MIWIFLILITAYAAVFAAGTVKYRGRFKNLSGKEHPAAFLYPAAALLLSPFRRRYLRQRDMHVKCLLQSLYVKENVEPERELYRIRKTAYMMAGAFCFLAAGLAAVLISQTDHTVRTLERGPYGQGATDYELDYVYRNQKDSLSLEIDSVKYTDSEILELFEEAYPEVRRIMLGENESQDHVTEPLNLISEYRGISIYWEIEDTDLLTYNGELREPLAEGESRTLNLYAEFSLEELSQIYTIPVRLEGETLTGREKLLEQIRLAVEESNDIHSRKVVLPGEIDGFRISFMTSQEENGAVFLLLSVVCAAAVLLFYDRSLEQKVQKRKEQMLLDFTEIVSKLSLLYEAGLSIHGAFERISGDYKKRMQRAGGRKEERYAYREMELALEKIRSGVSEGEAYSQFGKRCGLYPYIKLGNLLEQNLNKGTKGMKELLKKEVEESFEERKRTARKKGEEASTKMLLPMIMMLVVVIVIVAVPALMAMRF